jgi:hypothetical protein
MRDERILEIAELYRKRLDAGHARKQEHSQTLHPSNTLPAVMHARWMLDKLPGLVEQGEREKTFRWLGFIQGILWGAGYYTIEELRSHNRGG